MAELALVNLTKTYQGGYEAVKNVNLKIKDKEFLILVGPSGCGKSTMLRMIAGLEEISSGELWIDGKLVNYMEPGRRELSMVFQNYALYPHMTVYDNMAFSLRAHKLPKAETDRRVRQAASMLGIEALLNRKPHALSGGQKQRVAIGSVIVRQPKVYLMDEPLSNLDAKLRTQMRVELSKLHKDLGATIVYVTHDQVEAMTLGSRIVVMKDGKIQQVDTPDEVYRHPVNRFVAGFIGAPAMNILPVWVERREGRLCLEFAKQRLSVSRLCEKRLEEGGYAGRRVLLGIRPEQFLEEGPDNWKLTLTIEMKELLGSDILLHGQIGRESVCAKLPPSFKGSKGDSVTVYADMDNALLFDMETEETIMRKPV